MPKGKIEVAPTGGAPIHDEPLAGRANARPRRLLPRQLANPGVPIQPTQIRAIEAQPIEAEVIEAGLVEAGLVEAGLVEAGLIGAERVEAEVIEAGVIEADVGEARPIESEPLDAPALDAPPSEPVPVETVTVAKGPRARPLPHADGSERSLEEWIDETLRELPGRLLRRARDRTTHDVSLAEPCTLGKPARDLLDRPRLVKRVRARHGARVLRAPAELLSIFGTLVRSARGFMQPRRAPQRPGAAHAALLVSLLGAAVACRSGDVTESAPAPARPAVAAAGAPAVARVPAGERERPKASAPWRIPVGPKLIIAPGKGFGPVRFGARLETIERLIGEPCEEKREEAGRVLCRYSAQAVDFVLTDGVVTEMRAHRLGRPFKPEPKLDYGIFNGRFEQGVAFGMLPGAARELLGAPQATRTISEANPNGTVEVYDYDGFSLEFDRTPQQTVVLGGVVLRAPKS